MTARRGVRKPGLRSRLVWADAAGLGSAAAITEVFSGWTVSGELLATSPVRVVGATLAGITFTRWQQLYQAGRCAIRSAEFTGIIRVAMMLGAASIVADQFGAGATRTGRAAVLVLSTVVLMTLSRSLFRGWLRAKRSRGDYNRPITLVGANHDAGRIVELLRDHPEAGFKVVGVCGDIDEACANGLRPLWRGGTETAAHMVDAGESTGAVVVASALGTDELNDVVRDITVAGGHVHLSSGLRGIASERMTSEPIAHEPLLHIQPKQLLAHQFAVKRILDLCLASFLLVVAAPVWLAAFVAIRLGDRGPALFRQVRIGRDGRPFELLKFRTMVIDAEDRLDEVSDANERKGPLFKLDRDPRVTRMGRFLRATSIDELPQLWNVLRGEMSLVGPRPALPQEVRAFPPSLEPRTNVLPGITGLWQVEARDNPSFEVYSRLDLFYVENWTVTFDLVILLATIESELARGIGRLLQRSERRSAAQKTAGRGDPDIMIDLRGRSALVE